MNRITILFMAMAIALTGCNDDSSTQQQASTSIDSQEARGGNKGKPTTTTSTTTTLPAPTTTTTLPPVTTTTTTTTRPVPTTTTTTLPPVAGDPVLLQQSNIVYEGAFRTPDGTYNGDYLSFGGTVLAFNEARNSLFISTRVSNVGEITIPVPKQAETIEGLDRATMIQDFANPLDGGSYYEVGGDPSVGAGLYGMLSYGDHLIGSAAIYYDANGIQQGSHFTRLKDFSIMGSVQKWFSLSNTPQTGFVSGWMAHIPSQWQSALGGSAIAGQCCIPIISRTSYGPSAFAFNPQDMINGVNPVPTQPLVYYDGPHALGPWDQQSDVWNSSTSIGGVVFPVGSRTVLYVGRMGIGPFCYGSGTGDPNPGVDEFGHPMCYDPAFSSKGGHAYPYVYVMYAYDAVDLAAVKAGTKQPYDVKPYGVWQFDIPFGWSGKLLGGVTYDPSTQRIFMVQSSAEGIYAALPVIHVFRVR